MDKRIFETPPPNFAPTIEGAGCYIHYADTFLYLRRAPHKTQNGCWGVPAGKLDPNESPHEAALRELYEETQIKLSALTHFGTFYIKGPEFDYTYHTFYIRLTSKPAVILNPENDDHLWLTPTEAKERPLLFAASDIIDICLLRTAHLYPT